MVQPCEELWNWSWSCDVSNLQTMTIEIVIAAILAGIAIAAAVGFYFKEKSDRKESEKIIKKQGEIIEKQEEKERIHKENLLDTIRFYLENVNQSFSIINQFRLKTPPVIVIIDRQIRSIETNHHQLVQKINEVFSLGKLLPEKVRMAQGEIGVYIMQFRNNDMAMAETGDHFIVPDPSNLIQLIDDALKELPKRDVA